MEPASRPLPPDADRLLHRYSEEVHETLLRLRERILDILPDAHETVSDVGYTVAFHYGPDDHPGHAAVYLTCFAKHVNVGFPRGAVLPDPGNVLAGTGVNMRHVKVLSPEGACDAEWLETYVRAAVRDADWPAGGGDGETSVRPRR